MLIRLLSAVICLLLVIPTAYSQHNIVLESEARRLLDYFMDKESDMIMEMLTGEIAQKIPGGQLEEIALRSGMKQASMLLRPFIKP